MGKEKRPPETGSKKRLKPDFDEYLTTDDVPILPIVERIYEDGPNYVLHRDRPQLPPDEPEQFKDHPEFKGIKVGTMGTILRNGNLTGGRTNQMSKLLDLVEAGFTKGGLPRKVKRATEMAKTWLGPQPSRHHFTKTFFDGNSQHRISQVFWASNNCVLTDYELSKLNPKPLHPPWSNYVYCLDGNVYLEGRRLKKKQVRYPQITLVGPDNTKIQKYIHTVIGHSKFWHSTGELPDPNMDVAHLDNNKQNSCPDNLEVQTKSQNTKQASKDSGHPCQAVCLADGTINSFDSTIDASKFFNVKWSVTLSRWCRELRTIEINGVNWKFSFVSPIKKPRQPKMPAPSNRVWTVIPDFPEYEVSERGEIRKKDSKYLISQRMVDQYLTVSFGNKNKNVHFLVLITFHGPRPSSRHLGDHIYGDKLHNCRSQVRWTDKNVELALGNPCERQLEDGTWERFTSITAAGQQIMLESSNLLGFINAKPVQGPINETETRKIVQTKAASVGHVFLPHRSTAYGFKWRKLARGPDVDYECPDCHKIFKKPGEWKVPE